ncbi:MAG: phospho-sugar mutase, partial [Clostridia bacterium]|nr:phospho-sugar mutase [Clostridia bacterium]
MNFEEAFVFWKSSPFFDKSIADELNTLNPEKDTKEIEDRFYRDLAFGTGGLRGVMGAGTNRMNKYTVGKATKGLGQYLIDTYGKDLCKERGVAIGYDTRNNSEFMAKISADVLSGMGIRVYLHLNARPTPQLSYSVRFWNTLAGIVITASHNPKEYNGYKVYDEFGCQIVPHQSEKIIAYVNAVTDYTSVDFSGNPELITVADITDNFVNDVLKQSRLNDLSAKDNLKIVYTPLHGTGNIPVQKILALDGFKNVSLVAEQVVADGNFPTVASPNPEDRRALAMGIAQAVKENADIVLGTDPDCDRVG